MSNHILMHDGVVRARADALLPGQRLDLEADQFADERYWDACEEKHANPELESDHPEFQFGYEVVDHVEIEPHPVDPAAVVYFESGFVCGFPVDHMLEVDPEQEI